MPRTWIIPDTGVAGDDPHAMTDAKYEASLYTPENVNAWWDTTAALQEAYDPDAGRDIGEPDVDARDFRAWLRDYVSDAGRVSQGGGGSSLPYLVGVRDGLHAAALEIYARYEQETDDDDLF